MYFNMAAVPHEIVRLERMSDYRSVGLQRFLCTSLYTTEVPLYLLVYYRGSSVPPCLLQRFLCTSLSTTEVPLYLLVYYRGSSVPPCILQRFLCTSLYTTEVPLYLLVYYRGSSVPPCILLCLSRYTCPLGSCDMQPLARTHAHVFPILYGTRPHVVMPTLSLFG